MPGRLYVVEGCVSTNATYGNSFRPLTLYRLEASEAGGTLLTVSARIFFVRQINSLIRALIDRCGPCCVGDVMLSQDQLLEYLQLPFLSHTLLTTGRAADGGMRSNFAAVLATLAEEATVTDGKDARPASAEEEPLQRSSGASPDQQPAQPASSVAQDPVAASVMERLAAFIHTAACTSQVVAAAENLASRCGLDAAGCRPCAAVLTALFVFKLLGLLCRSELVAALAVASAAFLYFAEQPQGQPAEVGLHLPFFHCCG